MTLGKQKRPLSETLGAGEVLRDKFFPELAPQQDSKPSPEMQEVIDDTKKKIHEAFKGAPTVETTVQEPSPDVEGLVKEAEDWRNVYVDRGMKPATSHLPTSSVNTANLMGRLAAALERLKGERDAARTALNDWVGSAAKDVGELIAERDKLKVLHENATECLSDAMAEVDRLKSENHSLKEQIERLERALREIASKKDPRSFVGKIARRAIEEGQTQT